MRQTFTLICGILAFFSPGSAAPLPGVWVEAEGHAAGREMAGASAGGVVSLVTAGVSAVVDLPRGTGDGFVYLRYTAPAKEPARVDVYVGPAEALRPDAEGVAYMGHVMLESTGDKFQWASLPIGIQSPGKRRIFVMPRWGQADLDLIGVVNDETGGLWWPPNEVRDGKLIGEGRMREAVDVLEVRALPDTDRFAAREYAKKPILYKLKLKNNRATEETEIIVGGYLSSAGQAEKRVVYQRHVLPAGATVWSTLKVPVSGPGEYQLRIQMSGKGVEQSREVKFRVE